MKNPEMSAKTISVPVLVAIPLELRIVVMVLDLNFDVFQALTPFNVLFILVIIRSISSGLLTFITMALILFEGTFPKKTSSVDSGIGNGATKTSNAFCLYCDNAFFAV